MPKVELRVMQCAQLKAMNKDVWAENFLHPSEPELQAINSLEEKHTSIAHMLTEFEQSILSPESAICEKFLKRCELVPPNKQA